MITVDYDKEADAAYVNFGEIGKSEVARTYLCDPKENDGMINIDFDAKNQIIGIEILDASKKLSKEIIESARRVDK